MGSENEEIVYCGCHLYPPFDAIIQSSPKPKCESNYSLKLDLDLPLAQINAQRALEKVPHRIHYDKEPLGYELPNKPFKYLLKFMGPCGAKNTGIQVTNFEMLIREDHSEEVDEPESFKVGNITFYKRIPSCVKSRIAEQQKRLRNQLLELNFDRRDDWSNINRHSHVLKRAMVLPEFIINHKYYSTHVIFESIESLRKSEYLPPPFDNPFSLKKMDGERTLDRNPYVHWSAMIKDGQLFVQSEALDGFYRVESWDVFNEYVETKTAPILAPILPTLLKISV